MKKKLSLLVVLLVILAGIILAARYISGNSGIKEVHSQRPGEFANGQPYLTFKTNDFEVKYPNWPNIDKSKLAAIDNIQVAVANEGCNFIIKESVVSPNTTLEVYAEKAINASGNNLKINKKEINGNKGYLDADVTMGNVTLRNVSLDFKTGNDIYGIAFVAEKNSFSKACEPLVDEVNKSVIVN